MDVTVREPIPISMVAGQYLLFDINVVTYLRRTYSICGVLIGSIPQVPQQNVFLGLPVQLLPEEVKLLVEKEIAFVVDATTWHKEKFNTLKGQGRKNYLELLRSEGRKAQMIAQVNLQKRAERGLAKQALLRATKQPLLSHTADEGSTEGSDASTPFGKQDSEVELFDNRRSPSPTPSSTPSPTTTAPYRVTLTTTWPALPLSADSLQLPEPLVPSPYPLFAHLHAHNYFITPGLRFGCDYAVYPGDPLRFHSHFLVKGFEWDDEIPLLDLVGGGRLGTAVKKGFLIGGQDPDPDELAEDGGRVRTFCIEWGGM